MLGFLDGALVARIRLNPLPLTCDPLVHPAFERLGRRALFRLDRSRICGIRCSQWGAHLAGNAAQKQVAMSVMTNSDIVASTSPRFRSWPIGAPADILAANVRS
jgi:hypothetical protein